MLLGPRGWAQRLANKATRKRRATSKRGGLVFLSSKSRQPSESMTPSSCIATARTQPEATSKGDTHPSERCNCLSERFHLIICILPASQKGRYSVGVEPFQSSENHLWIKASFDSNFRADQLSKPYLLLSPRIAPPSASLWHFLERMILMVQSAAEGTVTFYADACQSCTAHQLWLSCLITKCPWIYF